MNTTGLWVAAALCVLLLIFCGVCALRSRWRLQAHRRGDYDRE